MRKAILKKWVAGADFGKPGRWSDVGPVLFHEFGCDFTEFETGAGNFSTALVEHPDGQMENVPVELIRFVDSRDDEKRLPCEAQLRSIRAEVEKLGAPEWGPPIRERRLRALTKIREIVGSGEVEP